MASRLMADIRGDDALKGGRRRRASYYASLVCGWPPLETNRRSNGETNEKKVNEENSELGCGYYRTRNTNLFEINGSKRRALPRE